MEWGVHGGDRRLTLGTLLHNFEQQPQNASLANLIGLALTERREFTSAVEYFSLAINLDPDNINHYRNLSDALSWLGRVEDEHHWLQAALRTNALDADIHFRIARWAERVDDQAYALQEFKNVVELDPENLDAYAGICRISLQQHGGEPGIAKKHAHETAPADGAGTETKLLGGMAQAFESYGRYGECDALWAEVLQRDPWNKIALLQGANAKLAIRQIEAAQVLYRRALKRYPSDASVVIANICFAIRTESLAEARRLFQDPVCRASLTTALGKAGSQSAPSWDGVCDISGKTVLLECAGAYGDNVQFARSALLLHELGARVIVQCLPAMQNLMRTLKNIDQVVGPYEDCLPFDLTFRSDLGPYVENWTWPWVKTTSPYLFVDDEKCSRWKRHFDWPGLKIGIVWRAEGHSVSRNSPPHKQEQNAYAFRSVPVASLKTLSTIPGASIIGLQVGSGASEMRDTDHSWAMGNLNKEIVDFTETAAAVGALDLVVTVDSSMAHIAGALGKACFLILPYYTNFRWMTDAQEFLDGQASGWYPSVRIFRQRQPGDWSSAILQVIKALCPSG
jgi:tetratricopeptide (TPR) repeat protein